MNTVKTVHCNLDLGKPKDWDETKGGECGSLPVAVGMHGAYKQFRSWWRPTPAELEFLQDGAMVCLSVIGATHPPVMLHVEKVAEPFEVRKPAVIPAGVSEAWVEKAMIDIGSAALAAGAIAQTIDITIDADVSEHVTQALFKASVKMPNGETRVISTTRMERP